MKYKVKKKNVRTKKVKRTPLETTKAVAYFSTTKATKMFFSDSISKQIRSTQRTKIAAVETAGEIWRLEPN